MYALLEELPQMSTPRPNRDAGRSPYPAPPPADYSDDVTDAHLAAIKECAGDEIDEEEVEIVSGPAW